MIKDGDGPVFYRRIQITFFDNLYQILEVTCGAMITIMNLVMRVMKFMGVAI